MRGDETGHSRTVTVTVALAITGLKQHIGARQDVANKVRMESVYAAVDDAHDDSFALVYLLGIRYVKKPEVPLGVANLISGRRSSKDECRDHCPDNSSRHRPQLM